MNWRPRSAACNPIAQHILLNRPTNMNRPRCNTGEFTENPQFRVVVIVVACLFATFARAQVIPNSGQRITPTAPSETKFEPLNPDLPDQPDYLAGQAVTSIVSPDGQTLLVLTSGYNLVYSANGDLIPADSTQFVFVYDISQGHPIKKQVLQVPNTYSGIVFDPSGNAFYVSGGVDDNVHAYSLGEDGKWAEDWVLVDTMGMLQQLGVLPAPGQAS